MILIVNLNASLDKKYNIGDWEKGKVMRARSVQNTPGGKGMHVAQVATILGADCVATGFLAGHNGSFIEDHLRLYAMRHDFIHIAEGETRCCLAFITDDGMQSEVLEQGPYVPRESLEAFLKKYDAYLDTVDMVAASGSLPGNVPVDFYSTMITMAKRKQKKFFLDTSGGALSCGIKAAPYFIKPNEDEITAYTGRPITEIEDVKWEIRQFLRDGISVAAVSLGSKGALVGYRDAIYQVSVPSVSVVNPVGSGDSFVGGFVAAMDKGMEFTEALKLAAACGTANAMEEETAYIRTSVVEELIKEIKVQAV